MRYAPRARPTHRTCVPEYKPVAVELSVVWHSTRTPYPMPASRRSLKPDKLRGRVKTRRTIRARTQAKARLRVRTRNKVRDAVRVRDKARIGDSLRRALSRKRLRITTFA